MPVQSHLSAAQRDELRAMLETKRSELRRAIDARSRPADDSEDRMIEEVDAATREISVTESETLVERDRKLLAEVERALAKMDAGNYGLSEASREPIPFARLRALPWARTDADESD